MSAKKNNESLALVKSRLKIESVEPRLLFSADLPAWHTEIDSVIPYTEQVTQLISSDHQSAGESIIPSSAATTVVIIDSATPDYQSLVDDIQKNNDSVAVYTLSADSDGLEQITSILANHSNIESLQIISHGSDGQLELGNTSITSSTLLSRATEISQWRDKFSTDADILIYGCELAATETGEQFVNLLGLLTSTEVAASNDKTGSTQNNTNWTLEHNTGSIESEIAISSRMQNDYTGVLAAVTVTTGSDTNFSGIVAGNPLHTIEWLKLQSAADISLREAIIAANNTPAETTTVTLTSATYLLDSRGADNDDSVRGDLDIKSDVVLINDGTGVVNISGNGLSRIFEVHNGASLSISEANLFDGDSGAQNGGAVAVNTGARFTASLVEIHNSRSDGDGGAISNAGTTTLTEVIIRSNDGANGAGIFNTGNLDISMARINSNSATTSGGGIYSTGAGTVDISNVTFSTNTAASGAGAMSLNSGSVINSTITRNTGSTTGGISAHSSTPIILQNVISANNTATNASNDAQDFIGPVISNGGNIIRNTNETGFNGADRTGVDPLLGSGSDHGGFSNTNPLLAGSPAIDFGTETNSPATDQRGYGRVGNVDSGAFEFNGVELFPITVTTTNDTNASGITPDNALHTVEWLLAQSAGDISLREAIIAANNTQAGPITINLGSGEHFIQVHGSEENVGVSGDFDIHNEIIIVGNGTTNTTINGNSNRIFNVLDGGTLTISDMTLTNGVSDAQAGGAVLVGLNANFIANNVVMTNNNALNGGAIGNSGTTELTDVSLTLNEAGNGGAISNIGTLIIDRTTIALNTATAEGGGIYSLPSEDVHITNSTISGNQAATRAGGLYLFGGTIINSTVVNNSAATTGGILNLGPLVVQNVISANNTSGNPSADFSGQANSRGGNIIENTNLFSTFSSPNDSVGVEPLLGALQDNGGITETHALLTGSVGINTGSATGAPTTDQRGFAREGALDSGSFEFITGSNTAPTLDSPAIFSVEENHSGALPIIVTDANGDPLTYSLSGTDDDSLFDIESSTGAVSFINPPDFEAPTDNGLNNVYNITLTADDSNGGVLNQALEITVTDAVSTLVVTTLNDTQDGDVTDINSLIESKGADGEISLREAITAANNVSDPVLITFDIGDAPVAGVHRLMISSALPAITNSVTIDGTTDSDYINSPVIVLDGSNILTAADGLQLVSVDTAEIRGLGIVNFNGTAIALTNSNDVVIAGNYIGTSGSAAEGNLIGIELTSSNTVLIGGNTSEDRNIISGNTSYGIRLTNNGTENNTIQGNYIGVDRNGSVAIANGESGVMLANGATQNVIDGNIISGNTDYGVLISGVGTNLNTVSSNIIGTDESGTSSVSNLQSGIRIELGASNNQIGGDSTNGEGNLISGNGLHGIEVIHHISTDNTISGNFIGTNGSGTAAVANGTHGIFINDTANTLVGGSAPGHTNIISGNAGAGIVIFGSRSAGSVVAGNHIGTDLSGNVAIANGQHGIILGVNTENLVIGGAGEGNLISGNSLHGIEAGGNNHKIQGNKIGTDLLGTTAIANGLDGIRLLTTSSTIGMGELDAASAGNVISGNGSSGIHVNLAGIDNLIAGNTIGLAVGGIAALGNTTHGIILNGPNNVIGGTISGQRNVIGFNGGAGIVTTSTASASQIQGNYIGITTDGNDAGNEDAGIALGSSDNTVGGTTTTEANIIAYNGGSGITVSNSAQNNPLLGNLIHANQLLSIDLATNLVTPNDTVNLDADIGANSLQNFPVIDQAVLVGANTVQVEGELHSTPNSTFRIEVFVNSSENFFGHGDAEQFLGTFDVTTDSNGIARYSHVLAAAANPVVGNYVSATATTVPALNSFGPTSEFSSSVVIADNFNPTTTGIPDQTINEDSATPTVELSNYFIDVEDVSSDLVYTIDTISNPTLIQTPNISSTDILSLPLVPNAFGSTDITITATNSQGASVQSTFTLTINPVNDPPMINSGGTYLINENITAVGAVTSIDVDGNAPTFSIVAGDDENRFTIDSMTGDLSFVTAPDYENPTDADANNDYELTVNVFDGTNSAQMLIIVSVQNVNDGPVGPIIDQDSAANEIVEGAAAGASPGINAGASDPDTSATIEYSLNNDAGGLFTIDNDSGIVTVAVGAVLDRETADSHTIEILATSTDGSTSMETFQITVLDLNDNAPAIQADQNYSIAEDASNTDAVATVIAIDADINNQLQNWSIDSGNSTGVFEIDQNTGELSISDETELDFETTPQYILGITVTDGTNTSVPETLVIDVLDINEAPEFTSTNSATATEQSVFNFTVTTSDVDSADSLSITASSLPSWLAISTTPGSNTATLSGTPSNADIGNYAIELAVTDSSGTSTSQTLSLSVLDINQSPVITSSAPTTATEDTLFSQLISAIDPDNDSLSFSADNLPAWLSLTDNGDGTATLQGTPENSDVGIHSFTIDLSDGNLTDTQIINIDIINTNDLPEIVFPGAISVNENTMLVGTVASNDIDGATPAYSLASTGDYQMFSIDRATGELNFTTTNDAENAADANADNVYEITVVVSDGSATPVSQDVFITVLDVNEFGISNLIDSNANVDALIENSTPGTNVGITVSANDADISDSVNYSLLQNSNGLFTIEPTTGEITLSPSAAIDYEQSQNHTVVVQATSSDGSTSTQSINISVVDVNEPPVINNTQHTSAEGFTGQIGSIEVTDPETDAIASFTIVGGSGQAAFEFGEGDQIVQTTSLVPGVYTLDVIVTDDGGISTEATLEIRVFASNDIPELSAAIPNSFTGPIINTTTTTPITSSGNEPESELPVTQEITDTTTDQVSEIAASEQAEPETNSIVGSSTFARDSLSTTDTRFEGSQAQQEAQLQTTDRPDGSRNPNSGSTAVNASTVALELILQNSENSTRNFDIDFDTINTSTTLTPALINAISTMNSDADSAAKKSEIKLELAIKTGTVVSVTLTVGIITWLMQTGAFLTTALSTAPLWRSLDPIPVLISSYDDEDDDMEQFDA